MSIPENFKTSLSVRAKQLPQFIRNEPSYQTFIAFLEAYYEWFAQDKNIEDRTKNLLNYADIDKTLDEFEEYFFNTFIKYFPKESLTNRRELVKFSKRFYETKSVPASFKFLFRSVYDADSYVYNTRESVLIASDGKWVQSKRIKLKTLDKRFLNVDGLKVIGETSKSIAKIERTQIVSNYIEVYLSDIVREFNSGEFVRIVDYELKDVYIEGTTLRAKVIGFVASLEINPKFRGVRYKKGDPVILDGGINPEIEFPKNAEAEVNNVTQGGLKKILVKDGSFGFRTDPNTTISITGGGLEAFGAKAIVSAVANTGMMPVTNIPVDRILPYANTSLDSVSYGFPERIFANNETVLLDALTLVNFLSYPLKEITVTDPGYFYEFQPIIDADSWTSANPDTRVNLKSVGILGPMYIDYSGYNYSVGNTIMFIGGSGYGAHANVTSVDANGSVLSIQYNYDDTFIHPLGGWGYTNQTLPKLGINSSPDKIYYLEANTNISEGSNRFYYKTIYNYLGPIYPYRDVTADAEAYGFITNPTANANTAIIDAIRNKIFPNFKKGMFVSGDGIAYEKTYNYFDSNTKITDFSTADDWIDISTNFTQDLYINDVVKVDGSALLSVKTILGDGETMSSTSDTIGEILDFTINDAGEDYIGEPTVYLSIMDIAVIDVDELNVPQKGDVIYQGDGISYPTFMAYFDSLEIIPNQLVETFRLRVYKYTGLINLDKTKPLKIDRINAQFTFDTNFKERYGNRLFNNGIIIYGNGKARANANFLNGTVYSKGKYLNSDGFLSSYNVLESMVYNDFTYILSVEKEFSKYKSVLYNLLHPSGKQAITRNIVNTYDLMDYAKSESNIYNRRKIPLNQLLEFAGDYILYYANIFPPNRDVVIGADSYGLMDRPLTNVSSTLESSLLFDHENGIYGVLIDENKIEIRNSWKNIMKPYLDQIMTTNSSIYMTSKYGEVVSSKVSAIDSSNNIITLEENYLLNLANIAYGYTSGNSIFVTTLTQNYDIISPIKYSDPTNMLDEVIHPEDYISIGNNNLVFINSIDYRTGIIYTDTDLISEGNVSFPEIISVRKNYSSNNILVDYNVDVGLLAASGSNIFGDNIHDLEITDDSDRSIRITVEV